MVTVNNPTEEDNRLLLQDDLPTFVRYIVGQKEIGEHGTPHLQLYLVTKNPIRLPQLKRWIPRAHLEKRRGSRLDALRYVLKEDTRCGDRILRGLCESELLKMLDNSSTTTLKERLEHIKEGMIEGKSELEVANEDFDIWVRHHRAFERYRMLMTQPRNHPVTVRILLGPTGTGKSKFALDSYPGAYWKQRSNWWDGYSGHKTVILDEFYGWLPFDLLLRICDRYPLLVESKGGQIQFVADTVIITSNSQPADWYRNVQCYYPSLYRRISEWLLFPRLGQQVSFLSYRAVEKELHILNDI